MSSKKYNYCIYTPQDVAKDMVKSALDNYFKLGKNEESLRKVRIGDLSCGNGNLLLEALEELLKLSKEIIGKYIYLKEWITGFDINSEAVKLTRIKGRGVLKKYGINGEVNILCEDSLQKRV